MKGLILSFFNNYERRENMDFSALEKSIGYTFKDKNLLKNALTHTSYAYENKVDSNEKLEFLGDSILEFLSSKYIYNNYTKLKEGEMTKVRADVVCEKSLYKVACKHNFSDFLYLGKSQKANEKLCNIQYMWNAMASIYRYICYCNIYFDSNFIYYKYRLYFYNNID